MGYGDPVIGPCNADRPYFTVVSVDCGEKPPQTAVALIRLRNDDTYYFLLPAHSSRSDKWLWPNQRYFEDPDDLIEGWFLPAAAKVTIIDERNGWAKRLWHELYDRWPNGRQGEDE